MEQGEIHVGTSGWTYDDWQGRFYPPEVKGLERLAFYSRFFDTVEVNATFYRNPGAKVIEAWNRRMGPDFHLVVKGSRAVTHHRRLKNPDRQLKLFLDRVLELKQLKVILWQLPPSLEYDPGLLESFLELLNRLVGEGPRQAVEFRHPGWWNDDTAEILGRHRAAFVAVSHPRLPDRILPTTDFLYLRFHGTGPEIYQHCYQTRELKKWADMLRPHLSRHNAYIFFNNDCQAHAPANAAQLRDLLSRPRNGSELTAFNRA